MRYRGSMIMGIVAATLASASPAASQAADPTQDFVLLDDAPHLDDAPFDISVVDQIPPTSPVSGGNDPNASDDVLYLLQSAEDEQAEIKENERGIIRPNGRPVGSRSRRRAHVFANPSARVAAKLAFSKQVSIEAFITGGAGAFEQTNLGFGTRATNISGGFNTTADFGLFNGALAFEHRNAYAERFGPWKSSGDKVGATLNKTLPFFIPRLTVTPQLVVTRDTVSPYNGSAATVEATAGLTYTVSPRLSFAASGGYTAIFLYGFPGYRHDNGLKLTIGTTFKATDRLVFTLGGTTNRTVLYGLPRYRADSALSPVASGKYAITSYLTASFSANYGRFFSTATGQSTFKYNLNPSLALTIPL